MSDEESSLDDFDGLFKEDGHYVEPPRRRPTRAGADSGRVFRSARALHGRVTEGHRRPVFTMREVMGVSTEEICEELGITANNCRVLIYRARMPLRECLEKRWFGGRLSRA